MKVIDKQLLFISSEERDSGHESDFTLSMPSHLLACQPHQKMRMVLNDVVIGTYGCASRWLAVVGQITSGQKSAGFQKNH